MKNTRLHKYLLGAIATLALASSVSMADTPPPVYIEPTNNDTGGSGSGNQLNVVFGTPGGSWQNWFINNPGITNYTVSFDTTNPPPTSPTGATLGSVHTTWTYDGTNAGTGSTFMCVDNNFWGGATVDASKYSSYEFDFKYGTNSTISPTNAVQFNNTIDTHIIDGNSGGFSLGNFANSGTNASNFDGNWHHIIVPIPPTIANAAQSKGPGYNWFNQGGTVGTMSFWQANLVLIGRSAIIPPPTMSFTPVIQGLNLWNDKAPNYTRHQVRTDTVGDFNVDWVGHTPVTYSWNLAHAPTNNGAGVNFAISPDPVASTGYADPDWSSTNCFYLSINEVGGTSVVANVTMKTNQAIGNSTAVSVGRLTNNTPTAAGTWTLTFTNNTDFVLTAPGGTNMAVTIPAGFLTNGAGANMYTGVSIFLSATPNNDNNYGSYADVTTFDVTGVGTPIHENFVTQGGIVSPFLLLQDQTYGFVPTNNAPNMLFITNEWNWLTWTIPDSQFSPVIRTNIGPSGAWVDSPLAGNVRTFGSTRYTLLTKAYQQASSQQYFGVIKRGFYQLQVLLPGETNAPGTPTGKTGTPTPLDFNATLGLITYTVNACSQDWHIIPGVFDTVTNSTTDGSASLPSPNPSLTNGTNSTIQIVFGQTGTFTITAADLTNTNILSNTSSPVTVQ